jgi:hypothetical protein
VDALKFQSTPDFLQILNEIQDFTVPPKTEINLNCKLEDLEICLVKKSVDLMLKVLGT